MAGRRNKKQQGYDPNGYYNRQPGYDPNYYGQQGYDPNQQPGYDPNYYGQPGYGPNQQPGYDPNYYGQQPGYDPNGGYPGNPGNGRKRKKKKHRKFIFAIEIIVLLVLALGLFVIAQLNRMDRVKLRDILVNSGIGKPGYRNIALFGVDSREGQLEGGTNSDTIIVASINESSGEVKLVSVYRDTYLDNTNGEYRKATEWTSQIS